MRWSDMGIHQEIKQKLRVQPKWILNGQLWRQLNWQLYWQLRGQLSEKLWNLLDEVQ